MHQALSLPSCQAMGSEMSDVSRQMAEYEFCCCFCLDVFTDPVTIPCGHNFCKTCIADYWKSNVPCQCPNCNMLFDSMPELHINNLVSAMAARVRRSAEEETSSSRSEPRVSGPGEVPCDVCTATTMRARKSCLTCLASYCETHLEPHLTASRLKRHRLINPVENPEGRVCMNHNEIMELFCRTDQTCVCPLCTVVDHKTHDVVPLREECEGKKAELEKTHAEIQQMIQKRQPKVQEFKRSVELSLEDADREIADGSKVFFALTLSIERRKAEFIQTVIEKHNRKKKQAEDYIQGLEREICELEKRSSELVQLSQSEDHVHLIQSFPSMRTAPPAQDWSEVSVSPPSHLGAVRAAVNQLEESLSEQMKKVFEAELKKIQRYAVDVTLDPDTAQPGFIVSDDGKQVTYPAKKNHLPICVYSNMVAKQSFSSGRFYYEVQVERLTLWALGIVSESVNRKAQFRLSAQNGSWMICLHEATRYTATADCAVHLSLKSPPKRVGVFVDYEEGLVSFYDVDTAAPIYSFTGCVFTEKIYPYFSLGSGRGGKNSAPLVITPVNHTE